ncbi:transcription antitermination factor NusB [Peptococcaceae bacterium]|nr:transcription antitermination factor NusB [Peptococcaceae bacterium]
MSRRQSREAAMQVLFEIELGQINVDDALKHVVSEFDIKESAIEFMEDLVRGVLQHIDELDSIIKKFSDKWELERMSAVDRNIMRVALYEMLYRDEIPSAVSINEAVELAKKFGGEESWRFVNGILGSAVKHLHTFFK